VPRYSFLMRSAWAPIVFSIVVLVATAGWLWFLFKVVGYLFGY
jgi:hypothetical protein